MHSVRCISEIKAADEGLVPWPTFGVYLSIPVVRVTLHNVLLSNGRSTPLQTICTRIAQVVVKIMICWKKTTLTFLFTCITNSWSLFSHSSVFRSRLNYIANNEIN